MMSLDVTWCHLVSPSVAPGLACTVPFSVFSGCSDPYDSGEEGGSPQPTKVDIDLELTAFANARRCAGPCPPAVPHPHLCYAPPTHQVLPPQVACS